MAIKSDITPPKVRQFAVYWNTGSMSIEEGESLAHVAKRFKRSPEPHLELIAILDTGYVIRPATIETTVAFATIRTGQ